MSRKDSEILPQDIRTLTEIEIWDIRNYGVSENELGLNEKLLSHHKHVFAPDRLAERAHAHVRFLRDGVPEPLSPLRLLILHDNIEVSEPGDDSDYSMVLDAPFYKLIVESSQEPGYVKLRKLEILQNVKEENETFDKGISENQLRNNVYKGNDDEPCQTKSDYTDSDRDSISSILSSDSTKSNKDNKTEGEILLNRLKAKLEKTLEKPQNNRSSFSDNNDLLNKQIMKTGRRLSGFDKPLSSVAFRGKLSNLANIKKNNLALEEEQTQINNLSENKNISQQKKRHTLKNSTVQKNAMKSDNSETTETESGYRSSSSPRTESSDSDYGYATITKEMTPKPLQRSSLGITSSSNGVLPMTCFTIIEAPVNHWSDDDDDKDSESSNDQHKNLYEKQYFLNSNIFMKTFVNNFMTEMGKAMGFSSDAISDALTQGASIYCDTIKNKTSVALEIIPCVIASWPNIANEWIIRHRRVIMNSRTNVGYQWPRRNMINKVRGLGCTLVPLGFRPTKGVNSEKILQWRVSFPFAERYLETCLAHSQVRCYMFTLMLYKSFMENDSAKIGLDAHQIKSHLFRQCEDNFAQWPEDRLGETLRIFLRSLYNQFKKSRLPDYFMPEYDHFKSTPRSLLLKTQRKLADILETPVMHILSALNNVYYTKKDFYPVFDHMKLYRILTTQNALRLVNPNINIIENPNTNDTDSEDEYKNKDKGMWEKAKSKDKYYQWKKEQQRQIQARRKAEINAQRRQTQRKLKTLIDKNVMLPKKLDEIKRRLILQLFIPHFIKMAEYSDKYNATKQGLIYLEQAYKLTIILQDDAAGQLAALEYNDIIMSKLQDFKSRVPTAGAPIVPKRNDSFYLQEHKERLNRNNRMNQVRAQYVNVENLEDLNMRKKSEENGIIEQVVCVDVHKEFRGKKSEAIELPDGYDDYEESKL